MPNTLFYEYVGQPGDGCRPDDHDEQAQLHEPPERKSAPVNIGCFHFRRCDALHYETGSCVPVLWVELLKLQLLPNSGPEAAFENIAWQHMPPHEFDSLAVQVSDNDGERLDDRIYGSTGAQ